MEEKEKQLFKALCKFKDCSFNVSLLDSATPTVLGYIFSNRMQGIAYNTLRKNDLLGKIDREFRNSLSAAYEQNIQKNKSFAVCVKKLSDILYRYNCNAAMLKGAYLCSHYPLGCRTSNDVDLLVLPKDVTAVGNALAAEGFAQGYIRGGEFVPASRHEIISSRMMRGETVPYIKEVNLPFMRFFEVDINFSLDYKNGNDDILEDMLKNISFKEKNGISIPTLDDSDFFIHLCAHLYKEATTLPWIKMHRDMTLYKYCDIYMFLTEMTDLNIQKTFERATALGMEKICAYAILETIDLFDMDKGLAFEISLQTISGDPTFCAKVVSPADRKTFIYQTFSASNRFFMASRINDLKEVV